MSIKCTIRNQQTFAACSSFFMRLYQLRSALEPSWASRRARMPSWSTRDVFDSCASADISSNKLGAMCVKLRIIRAELFSARAILTLGNCRVEFNSVDRFPSKHWLWKSFVDHRRMIHLKSTIMLFPGTVEFTWLPSLRKRPIKYTYISHHPLTK